MRAGADIAADPLTADRSGSARAASGGAGPVRIAYLTNAYPKVSHSFIRREILALEARGFDVLRFAIRASGEALPDPDDRAEAERTLVLLDDKPGLVGAAIGMAISRPLRLGKALAVAMGMAKRGSAGLVRHIAYLAEACRLVRLMEAGGVAHVHVHFGTNPAAVARLAGRLGDVSYSFTVHGPDEFDAPQALSLPEKIADAAFVAAISDYGRAQLMRWSRQADWPKIKVVRCGIDRRFLQERPAGAEDAGLHSRTIACVARLSAQKGLPLLLEAAAMVARDTRFELRIVGDGELRPQIEARIAELGLGDVVHILGWRSAEEVQATLLSARAMVLPSFAEGLPVVLMEALALGRPVVTTAIAGIPELVDEGCGWVVPAGSVERLAEALREVLRADAARLAEMGQEGRRRVSKLHDIDTNAAGLAELLRPFVGESERRRVAS